MLGVGAANTRTALVMLRAGVKAGNIIMVDRNGILHPNRKDVEAEKEDNPWKWNFCLETNSEGKIGDTAEALKGADVCISAAKPGPNTIKKIWISSMASDSIVFACANPIPEIWPWEAKQAGAKIVATGRSDFANQINNSLGFPAIFRGVLDVKAKTVTDYMCIAAANELARFAEERGINEDNIVPTMDEWEVFPREAVACALESIKEGVARVTPSRQELYERATHIIKTARESTELLMKKGLISPPPKDI
jgi:malate dehydrogenase (oxaloacetate-decarboxylating)